jgi:hypothetical protein
MEKESSGLRPVEANSTGSQGSRRAVALSGDDDDDDNDESLSFWPAVPSIRSNTEIVQSV